MQKQLHLKYTYGNHNYKEWLLYWGVHGGDERDTLLLRTKNEALARERYNYYKANPPKVVKLDVLIF